MYTKTWDDASGHWHRIPEEAFPPEHLPWTSTGAELYAVTLPGHGTGIGRTPEEAMQTAQSEQCAASSCGLCGRRIQS